MSRAFLRDDAEGEMPRRNYHLPERSDAGYDRAFTTILDAHITQLAICAVMIGLGTGPIKGFGVTLLIGVLSTLFSVLITAHMILEMLIEAQWVKKIRMKLRLFNVFLMA